MASPYVSGHRGRTFVVTIPGDVVARRELLYPLLEGGRCVGDVHLVQVYCPV
jgi:hypothetical protein